MKLRLVAIFLFTLLTPFALMAEGVSGRTGFVDGPVWFSEEVIKLNENVKVYTAVFNGEESKLKVKVDFINEMTAFSSKEIVVNPNETKTVSVDWKASEGSNKIYAIISKSEMEGVDMILSRVETGSMRFALSKDNPSVSVQKSPIYDLSNIFDNENGFLKEVDSWFKLNFTKSEEFREEKSEKIDKSKDLLQEKRNKEKDKDGVSAASKALSFLHLMGLSVLSFIFSISIIFYLLIVLLLHAVLRFIWRGVKRVFRKRHEE